MSKIRGMGSQVKPTMTTNYHNHPVLADLSDPEFLEMIIQDMRHGRE